MPEMSRPRLPTPDHAGHDVLLDARQDALEDGVNELDTRRGEAQ